MKQLIILLMLTWGLIEAFGQSFDFRSTLPFGIQATRSDTSKGALNYVFYDCDDDGDEDLILIGYDSIKSFPITYSSLTYFVDYQENWGTKTDPDFDDRVTYVENFPFPHGLFAPITGDLNGDEQMDWIIHAEIDSIGNQHPLYYRATSSGSYEIINLTDMQLYPLVPRSFFFPHLTDLDQDGDLDLLLSGAYPPFDTTSQDYEPIFLYAKNIGTPLEPKFMGWFDNPYGLQPNVNMTALISGDIDRDGDMDLLGVELDRERTPIYYYENTGGSSGKPSFAAPVESPFGLPMARAEEQYLSPCLVDIDGDQDLDFFVFLIGEAESGLLFFENTSIFTGLAEEEMAGIKNLQKQIKIFPNPSGNEIIVNNESPKRLSLIRMYKPDGRFVKEIQGQGIHRIFLGDLEGGVYILKLQVGQKTISRRIIKI